MPQPTTIVWPAPGCARCSAPSCAAPTSLTAGAPRTARRSRDSLTSICEQGAVTLLTIEAGADTAQRVELEAVLLPLMHADNTMDRIIGAMSV